MRALVRRGVFAAACLAASLASARAQAQCRAWTPGFAEPGSTLFTIYHGSIATSALAGTPQLYMAGGAFQGFPVRTPRLDRWDGLRWHTEFQPPPGPSPVTSFFYGLTALDDAGVPELYAVEVRTGIDHVLWRGRAGTWTDIGHFDERVVALCRYDAGGGAELYAGGLFALADGVPAFHVAKWDGVAWSSAASGLIEPVGAFAVYDAGNGPRLYAGQIGPDPSLISLQAWDGVSWSNVPGGLVRSVEALRVCDFGGGPELYAGGRLTNPGLGVEYLARWNGTTWSGIGALDGVVHDFEFADLGAGPRLLIGGQFYHDGAAIVARTLQWDGSALTPLDAGVDGEVFTLAALTDGAGARVYAHGNFGLASGAGARRIASFDGAAWSPIGRGFDGDVEVLTTFDDGTGLALWAGGTFDIAGGGTYARRTARWDGVRWNALPDLEGGVYDFASADVGAGPELFACGTFISVDSLPSWGVARWAGTHWTGAGTGVRGQCFALHAFDDGSGVRVAAGGQFTLGGGSPGNYVAAWNGTTWSALGSGMDDIVAAFAVHDDGAGERLFAGGTFTTADGAPAPHIARWDGNSWTDVGGGFDAGVNALCVFDDGAGAQLYAGGVFTQAGGVPVSFLARWDGNTWSDVPGGGADGAVLALSVHDDGRGPALYVAGGFAQIGGVFARNVARFDGQAWEALAGGADNAVSALASFDDGNDGAAELWLGGRFKHVDDLASGRIARWSGCPRFERFCFGDGIDADVTTACPCGNFGAPQRGCAHSSNTGGASLDASGATNPDTLVLAASGMPSTTLGLYMQHDAQDDRVFHDGVLCASGNLTRLRTRAASAGASVFPNGSSDTVTLSQRGMVTPGSGLTRFYAVWYRNASSTFCPPATANVTNGVRVSW